MRYIDKDFYDNTFGGSEVPEGEFEFLANVAEDVVDSIVTRQIDFDTLSEDEQNKLKRAVCYEIMYLQAQGGTEAVNGFFTADMQSESLGDYSVSRGNRMEDSKSRVVTANGIPLHSMTLALLKAAGLYSVWVYKGTVLDNGIY